MQKILMLSVAAFMFGCAHGKVEKVEKDLDRSLINKTTPILVEQINTKQAAFEGYDEKDGDKKSSDLKQIENNFANEIVKELRAEGYNANIAPVMSKTGIVISGNVTMVDRGSAAKRIWVGMGAGASNLKTEFTIEDRSKKQVLSKFVINATSGGRGGLSASGSFIDEHITDGSEKVTEFILGKK
jgi:Domain of unknown function (DUF4410)